MFDSADMFRAFQPHRDKAIVVVTGTSGRDWSDISTTIAFEEARKNKRPVAVLVGDEYHGFNRM